MTKTSANLPPPNTPFLDSRGIIASVWWNFILALFNRTGGAGVPPDLAAIIQLIKDAQASGEIAQVAATEAATLRYKHSQRH